MYLSSIIDNGIIGGAHRQHEGIAGSDGNSCKSEMKNLCFFMLQIFLLPRARYRGLVPRVSDKTNTTGTIIVTMVELEATFEKKPFTKPTEGMF